MQYTPGRDFTEINCETSCGRNRNWAERKHSAQTMTTFSLGKENTMTSTRQTRNLFFGISLRGATVELALTTVLVLTVLTTLSARAQAFQVIYNFTGWTGHNPKRV